MAHTFKRLGGAFHLKIDSFEDLRQAMEVPEAHWIATACPTTGLNCDPKFLQCLDTDGNGRVRAEELKEGIRFASKNLKNTAALVKGSDTLLLDDLSGDAAAIRKTAEYVLDGLGAADRTRITLAQVRSVKEVQTKVSNNGDGVITAANVGDDALRQLVTDILSVYPGVTDESGDKGVTRDLTKDYGAAREAALAWVDQESAALKWGAGSVDGARHVKAVQAKVDEYFLQCRLVAAQPAAAERLQLSADTIDASVGNAAVLKTALDRLPVAPPVAGGLLRWADLTRGTAYEAMQRLAEVARLALAERAQDALTEVDWRGLVADADTILAWADAKDTHKILSVGVDRLRATTAEQLAAVDQLCADDAAVSDTLARVAELERLVLYQRWLFELANNFISMPLLYDARRHAIFEQGELIIAGRNFPFSTLVESRGAHSGIATQSSCFLMYVQVQSPGKTLDVCVPVTAGTSDGLYVGKRGIFRTLDGVEHDAIVTQTIVNPVSIYEAITQPFNRIVGFIESRVQKWSDSANADFDSAVNSHLDSAQATASKTVDDAKSAATAPAPAATPAPAAPAATEKEEESFSPAMLVGAGSIIGSIGLVVGSVIGALAGLSIFQLAMAFGALLLIIAAPFAALAWLKLRRRNLAGVLEAAGWALNERLMLTRQLGLLFTYRPPRPAGSSLDWTDGAASLLEGRTAEGDEDPVEAKKRARLRFWLILMVVLVVLWQTGIVQWALDFGQPFLMAALGKA